MAENYKIPEYSTITRVSKLLQLDFNTVSDRMKDFKPEFVDGSHKLYKTIDLIKSSMDVLVSKKFNMSMSEAKLRNVILDGDLKEQKIEREKIENGLLIKDLIHVESQENVTQTIVNKIRDELGSLPSKLSRQLAQEDCSNEIRALLKDAILQLEIRCGIREA